MPDIEEMYARYYKRLLDIILACMMAIALLPILLIIYCVLYISQDEKPFFLQPRPGKFGKVFRIIKFRTMVGGSTSSYSSLGNATRLTKIGKFLRHYSLDELPQLINVLKGEMSFVGPRPLLLEYLHNYTSEQMQRHNVLPGITGWAQLHRRDNITWEKKLRMDVWYVQNLSFKLDMKILFYTMFRFSSLQGAETRDTDLMPKFSENKSNS